ncbi:MAG: hypothetical protein COU11_04605 [Candidatus Harrisonbacteria bacterium CG10_big_fil_rev_8_21_14_0_10_49_15]|uniref:Uncharacterized protein n=1 Tax=Candidatus Harrisonbacteria bacterium CG10_big_fil_rev_8_21_14_0_10_49_15 TaxID=1974587 RepID=A0A2H0UK23_9BACT|nr:MAG: hypothetical protein COU11_04605 [Candidatus Harrisonbacteria bacterium CG10_big_fil_rev_8_21_14_0_10_49_15]
MNKKFTTVTNLLRSLEPSREFMVRSKQMILSTAQEPLRRLPFRLPVRLPEGVTIQTAFAFASVILVVLAGGVTYFNTSSGQLAQSFNDDTLMQEVRTASFEIQIAEAQYYDQSATAVALALEKISGEQDNEKTIE